MIVAGILLLIMKTPKISVRGSQRPTFASRGSFGNGKKREHMMIVFGPWGRIDQLQTLDALLSESRTQ